MCEGGFQSPLFALIALKMRLINLMTRELEEFVEDPPPYFILSHTWGAEEVSFQEYTWIREHERELAEDLEAFSDLSPRQLQRLIAKVEAVRSKAGFTKIENCIDSLVGFLSESVQSSSDRSHYAETRGQAAHKITESIFDMLPEAKELLSGKISSRFNGSTQPYPQTTLYLWADTCCIDKSSSAELSEAINSMCRWYQRSQACIVYLSDISKEGDFHLDKQLETSRWFSRGWTLQEYLAPAHLVFFDREWEPIVTRGRLKSSRFSFTARLPTTRTECQATIVDVKSTALATKMFWAAGRSTTRTEDVAYSLLGLFDVNLPLLYGEGSRAFERLQQQILTQTQDFTLLAWGYCMPLKDNTSQSLFATSPRDYQHCENLKMQDVKNHEAELSPFQMSNKGLLVSLDVYYIPVTDWTTEAWYALLPCLDVGRFSADGERFSACTQLALVVRPKRKYVKALSTPITMERLGVVPIDGGMGKPEFDFSPFNGGFSGGQGQFHPSPYDIRRPMFLTEAARLSVIHQGVWLSVEYDKDLRLACTEIYPPSDGLIAMSQRYPSRHGFSVPIVGRNTLTFFAMRPTNPTSTDNYETEGVIIAVYIKCVWNEPKSIEDLTLNLLRVVPIKAALGGWRSLADLFLNVPGSLDPDYWSRDEPYNNILFQADVWTLVNEYIKMDFKEITLDLNRRRCLSYAGGLTLSRETLR